MIEPGTTLRGRTRVGARQRRRPAHDADRLGRRRRGARSRTPTSSSCEVGRPLPGRAVRLSAARGDASRGRQGRHFRRGQELRARRGRRRCPHLSYIGDADVGAGSNLGAGTITANYDGSRKHRTKIGRDVRTGVDTALVAPVNVGDARLHWGRLGDHRGRSAGRAGDQPRPSRTTSRATPTRRRASELEEPED